MKTKTPLIDLAPKMFATITSAQDVLSKWILPDSEMTDSEALSLLVGILDTQNLVKGMREVFQNNWDEKYWEDSPNVEYTFFSKEHGIMEIKMKNGVIYQYLDFTEDVWEKLKECVSIGSFLHRNVKGNFRYVRVS